MIKIQTALVGSFGQELSTSFGNIKFDANGIAEVTEEIAEGLVKAFPDVYFREGEKTPTPKSGTYKDPSNDPTVQKFAETHLEVKNREASGEALPSIVKSTSLEAPTALLDKNGNALEKSEAPAEEAKAEEKTETVVEEKKEEAKSEEVKPEVEANNETVSMLKELSVEDIHSTLVAAGVQDEATAKITDKNMLVLVAAKKLQ